MLKPQNVLVCGVLFCFAFFLTELILFNLISWLFTELSLVLRKVG